MLYIQQIVNGNYIYILSLNRRSENHSTNSTETVNPYF